MSVTLDDIRAAARQLEGHVIRTPLVPAPRLSEMLGSEVHLKLENHQYTGSFKDRGAFVKLSSLSDAQKKTGVIAMSAGNHAQGVAYHAQRLGIPATIVMPETAPFTKVERTRGFGARVVQSGETIDEAATAARELMDAEGLTFVHPYDDERIIAGQGTIGLELLEDLPSVETTLVPLSGGGLIAGIAVALKAADPAIRVVGISMERGPAMYESLRAGKPVPVEEQASLADSLGGGIGLDNRYTFPLVRDLVDEVVLVGESEIAAGMTRLYRAERLVTEGAAAVGVAALMSGRVRVGSGPVATIVSGCNVDMDTFTRVVTGDET